jgi:inhibitor of KinA sporulation pathway (predicted exonuclease)
MNILVIDAEYNQPSGKTIQIGAAVFKVKTGEMIESTTIYVNPGEPITPFITELTGVTDADVANGASIHEAYLLLKYMHERHKCFRNPLVWGSGVRNDSQHIYDEAMALLPLESRTENFMGFRVIDAKTLFQSIKMYQNQTVRGGLKKSMESIGLKFEGNAHDALADAINTFRIWHHMLKGIPKL